jgi:hypothetical protein
MSKELSQGYSQVKGLDFDETFTLVARLESIRMLLDYATHHGFKLYQMDYLTMLLTMVLNFIKWTSREPS